jgi:hypothetical protein
MGQLAVAFAKLCGIKQRGKLIEMKHRVVLAVLAEERDIVTEVHILQMVGNKASVTPLNALSEIAQNLFIILQGHIKFRDRLLTEIEADSFYYSPLGRLDKLYEHIHFFAIVYFLHAFDRLSGVQL